MSLCTARPLLQSAPPPGVIHQPPDDTKPCNKKERLQTRVLPEASAALRNERRPGEPTGSRRKDGSRHGRRVRPVRRPQGVTKAPRAAGRAGRRTPGLLRGGRPPLDATASSGNLKLLTARRAKPYSMPARSRRNLLDFRSKRGVTSLTASPQQA